ncbi:FAD/NAD(P)-binding domain-containing protein [Protomyces lactucae-debilis]|uniref:FAD/NAD(P)-binding domain-containing protein n=1 Tax=Protomyces lactucae-debilis TaxID=2754530 RepID=A0A1Y2FXB1_PROLT|nr:FAD/NAD(P)-binding domain-containing protein [Protomyces lactucae-debilis]ORY87934.1 FAD/NAD(P)-binding domain-containing protein [Protomyces lactucae-debilis]
MDLIRRGSRLLGRQASSSTKKQRIVIIGSGWAGFTFLQRLDARQYEVFVISPRSYFVFTPLLAGTAVGTLEFRCALESVRATRKCHFHEAWAESIDFDKREVTCSDAMKAVGDARTFAVPYDQLILAPGSYSNTFDIPGVHEHAHFLKSVEDARRIRNRVLACFEQASSPTTTAEERARLLTFCIVGGGPTGVEFAAELHDLVAKNLNKLYPDLAHLVKIEIFDIAESILVSFDKKLASYAQARFARDGIKVHTKQSPKRVLADRLVFTEDPKDAVGDLQDKPYGMLVWSTGLMASPLVQLLGKEGLIDVDDKTHALLTNGQLQVLHNGLPRKEVYALGDCATIQGQILPATAQVASQKGQYLASILNTRKIADFKFVYRGSMAFLGGGAAIVDASQAKNGPRISGRVAYIMWKTAYLTMTVSWRNKVLIPTYWLLNAIFGRDINRF